MGWFLLGLLLYFLVLLAERSLVALSSQDAEQLRADDSKAAQRAYALTRDIRPVMAALLLARLLLKLLLSIFLATSLMRSQGAVLYHLSQQWELPGELLWSVSAIAFALTLSTLFWALKSVDNPRFLNGNAIFLMQRLGWFVLFWKKIFSPIIKREKPPSQGTQQPTATDLAATKVMTETSEKRELELLKSIVKFGDVTVKQVMQPRSKVVALDFRTDFHELLATVREAEFSRFPVYHEELDNVTGILYVKDIVPHLDRTADFEWQSLIRTNLLLVPESKRGAELLREFKEQKIHMAVVVDEYGGVSGIVTLEDILEEVTGDIRDEFDEESEVRFRKLDEYNYLFEGQTLLNDVCRIAGLDEKIFDTVRGNADTLAGLVLELKGDIPKSGAEIAWNDLLLTVTAADSRRIEQLKLTLPRLRAANGG
ncbi:MAG: CBS domain-containing protein [Saprospiraceae bacterium]|nr:CBS domain-containing protein [Saprospiraceae bacterium]